MFAEVKLINTLEGETDVELYKAILVQKDVIPFSKCTHVCCMF